MLVLLQKRAIRTLFNVGKTTHTEPLFKQLNILWLEQLNVFFQLTLARSLYYRFAPVILCQLVPLSEGRALASHQHKVNYNYPNNVLLKLSPEMGNKLPQHFKLINNPLEFKKIIKRALVMNDPLQN